MKRFIFAVVIILISAPLAACHKEDADPVPYRNLSFILEQNPKYVGSYTIDRTNFGENWEETGEWTAIEATFSKMEVCFGYFDETEDYGVFTARSDYEWVEVPDGSRLCLRLQKRQ
jgi:hypothetical protein